MFVDFFYIFWRRRRRLHVDASYFFDDNASDSTSTTSRCFFRRRRTLRKGYKFASWKTRQENVLNHQQWTANCQIPLKFGVWCNEGPRKSRLIANLLLRFGKSAGAESNSDVKILIGSREVAVCTNFAKNSPARLAQLRTASVAMH